MPVKSSAQEPQQNTFGRDPLLDSRPYLACEWTACDTLALYKLFSFVLQHGNLKILWSHDGMTAPSPLCYRVRTGPVVLERLDNTSKSNKFSNSFPHPPPGSFLPLERRRLYTTNHLAYLTLYRSNRARVHPTLPNPVWREPLKRWKQR